MVFSAVFAAGLAAALAAPRATEPDFLPLPEPRRTKLAQLVTQDQARVARARQEELSFEIRSIGETLRRFGQAAAQGSSHAEPLRRELIARAKGELEARHGEALLALRAVQTELFVTATHAWEESGRIERELRELGGDFPELARRNGWLEGTRLTLADEERALLFRVRWNDLTHLGAAPPFAASLDELRELYALLLRHASGEPDARLKRQLGYVAAIEKLDRDYPAHFARGVLLYQAEAYAAAADAFGTHLAAHPDGPWTLRAKNHLLAARARAPSED